jgi:hypothetical protein
MGAHENTVRYILLDRIMHGEVALVHTKGSMNGNFIDKGFRTSYSLKIANFDCNQWPC